MKNLIQYPLYAKACQDGSCGFHMHLSHPTLNINSDEGRAYLSQILADWQGVWPEQKVLGARKSERGDELYSVDELFVDKGYCRQDNPYALQMHTIPREKLNDIRKDPSEKNIQSLLIWNAAQIEDGRQEDRYQSLNVISRPNGVPYWGWYQRGKIKGYPRSKPYPVHIELRGHMDFFEKINPGGGAKPWDVDRCAEYLINYLKAGINFMEKARITASNMPLIPRLTRIDIMGNSPINWYPELYVSWREQELNESWLEWSMSTFLQEVACLKGFDNSLVIEDWANYQQYENITSQYYIFDMLSRLESNSFSNPKDDPWMITSHNTEPFSFKYSKKTIEIMNKLILKGFLRMTARHITDVEPLQSADIIGKSVVTKSEKWYNILIKAGVDSIIKFRKRLASKSFNNYSDEEQNRLETAFTLKTINSFNWCVLRDLLCRVNNDINTAEFSKNLENANINKVSQLLTRVDSLSFRDPPNSSGVKLESLPFTLNLEDITDIRKLGNHGYWMFKGDFKTNKNIYIKYFYGWFVNNLKDFLTKIAALRKKQVGWVASNIRLLGANGIRNLDQFTKTIFNPQQSIFRSDVGNNLLWSNDTKLFVKKMLTLNYFGTKFNNWSLNSLMESLMGQGNRQLQEALNNLKRSGTINMRRFSLRLFSGNFKNYSDDLGSIPLKNNWREQEIIQARNVMEKALIRELSK